MSNENNCGCNEEKDTCGCGCNHNHEHNHKSECGCGCGEEHHEHFVVDLEDENGNTVSCAIIDAFEFEENEYILAQDPNEDSVYLFRALEDGELVIPEEEEFNRVSKFYSEEVAE
ncbi:MAG: DUF1292 domain-containing protein [Clostridium sp.]|nr:DUF1292 domain-containing protein [Clostridium sp.]